MNSNLIKEKERYISLLEKLLISDYRSSVKSLHYGLKVDGIGRDEIVYIEYRGGHITQILVTGNSLGSITKEVIKEVYK